MKRKFLITVTTILLVGTFIFITKENITHDTIPVSQKQQFKEIKNKEGNTKPPEPKVLTKHNRIEIIYDDGTRILEEVLPNKKDTSLYTFHDGRWNTSVDFSNKLSYEIDSIVSSPDSGINIFLDNDDKKDKHDREYISVYGCVGHLQAIIYNNTKKEDFSTNQKVKRYLYTTKNKQKEGYTQVDLILGDGFIGARCFYKNENERKTEIINILKTIQLHDENNRDFMPELYSEDKSNN